MIYVTGGCNLTLLSHRAASALILYATVLQEDTHVPCKRNEAWHRACLVVVNWG